jgi:hypothetical protein
MKHGTKYITVDLFQNILISEVEQMYPFFPSYCTRDKSTYSPFQNLKLARCIIQRGLIVMGLSMTAVREILSRSEPGHARNVESVFPAVQLTIFHMP